MAHRASVAAAYQAEASISAQSAYIEPVFGHAQINLGETIRTPFTLKNSGADAAKNIKFIAEVEFIPRDSAPDLIYRRDQTISLSVGRLGSGEEYPSREQGPPVVSLGLLAADRKLARATQRDVDDFSEGRKVLYTYLRLSYDDVFGHHWVTKCRFAQKLVVDQANPTLSVSHPTCDSYNKSDVSQPLYAVPNPAAIPPNPPEIVCMVPEEKP